MALDIVEELYMTTIFIKAAVDPVGCEDRTEYLTVDIFDENVRSENSVKIISG